ncbi:hypothetical protein [Bosea sp. Root381]|uniref:hypothetical protein n=1 Tax=Bosea sp. Root381 TaxID=1736524 RepID=UPI000A963117|nr:hypothetical protein [Bosea sp. Root381]
MMDVADFATLGRLEGAGHARAMMENGIGAEPVVVALFEVERLRLIMERMRQLQSEGAGPDALAVYGEHVNRRFAEAVAEIALDMRLAAVAPAPAEPSPPERKTKRAARRVKTKGLH